MDTGEAGNVRVDKGAGTGGGLKLEVLTPFELNGLLRSSPSSVSTENDRG